MQKDHWFSQIDTIKHRSDLTDTNAVIALITAMVANKALFPARQIAYNHALWLSKYGQIERGPVFFDEIFNIIAKEYKGTVGLIELWGSKGNLYSQVAVQYIKKENSSNRLELLRESIKAFSTAYELTRGNNKIDKIRVSGQYRRILQCKLKGRLGNVFRMMAQEGSIPTGQTAEMNSSLEGEDLADVDEGLQNEEFERFSELLEGEDFNEPEADNEDDNAVELAPKETDDIASLTVDVPSDRKTILEQAAKEYKVAIEAGEELFRQQAPTLLSTTKRKNKPHGGKHRKLSRHDKVLCAMYLIENYIGRAMVVAQQTRLEFVPKLTAYYDVLTELGGAVSKFQEMLWGDFDWSLHPWLSGYGKLRKYYVTRQLAVLAEWFKESPKTLKLLQQKAPELARGLLRQLADFNWRLGNPRLAGWLFTFMDEYSPQGETNLQMQVERGTLEQDINLLFALERLERLVLSMAFTADFKQYSPAARRSLAHAVIQVTNLLNSIGAESEVELYRQRGLELIAGDSTPEGTRVRKKLRSPSAKTTIEEDDPDADVSEKSNVDGKRTGGDSSYSSKLMRECSGLESSRQSEDAYWVVNHLWRMSEILANVQSADISVDLAGRIERTFAAVYDWRPSTRRTYHGATGIEHRWMDDPLAAAACCARLAWEFADKFRAGSVHRVIATLIWIEEKRQGGTTEEIVGLWEEAARSAASVWHWRHTADWSLLAAKWHLNKGDREKAIHWAEEASTKLAVGIDRLRFGSDKADAVQKYHDQAVRAATILAKAGAQPGKVFEAFERCKGNITVAARYRLRKTALTEEGKFLENELWRLTGLEQRLAWQMDSLKQSATETDMGNDGEASEQQSAQTSLRECRTKIDAMWAKLAQESPESLQRLRNVFSEDKLEMALALEKTGPIAIIGYLCDDHDIWGVAAKYDGYSVTYFLPENPCLASRKVVTGRGQALNGILRATLSGGKAALSADPSIPLDYQMKSLYKDLIKPFAGFIRGVDTLCVVPHEEIASLPFPAFRAESGEYLAQMFYLTELTSLNLWLNLLHVPIYRGDGLLGLGWDSDIGATEELASLRETLDSRITAHFCLPDDVKRGIRQLLKPRMWTVIHVAAHADFKSADYGTTSALLFPEDQKVTVQTLLQNCGRAQLVVLNCCSAGQSSSQAGDLYGFPFALTSTGSLSVVLPIIPIHCEAARRFAEQFYAEFQRDPEVPKLRAFSAAIRGMITEGWKHPAAWAPYIFVGHPGPMVWTDNNASES